MQTATGRDFVLRTPHVEPGHLFTEIAPALARIPRFNGHTVEAYSVAQHSVLCAEAAEDETGDLELAAYCLLHDAHEAYVGDITRPVIAALAEQLADGVDPTTARLVGQSRAQHFHNSLHRVKAGIDTEIAYAAGLDIDGLMRHRATVMAIDLRALRTERDDLMLDGSRRWEGGVEGAVRLPVRTGRIRPLSETQALAAFAEALQRLCPSTAAANPARW